MKKILLIFLLLILAGATGWAALFYQKNLSGIGPAVKNPSRDITESINTTGMPLKLPAGFSIEIFAKNLENPRVLAFDPAENLVVSIPGQGRVVAFPDRNKDGIADEAIIIAEGLNRPHGLATRCTEKCQFYIAESDKVVVYDYEYDESKKFHFPKNGKKIIDLPNRGNHFTRTLLFLPEPNDNKLLVSVGSSCNVCRERDWRRAKILVANADGTELKEFAKGLRNAVFMAVHPETKKIWATEMGRDLLSDNLPPDEINIIEGPSASSGQAKNYGWPICYGKNIHDSVFDKNTYIRNPCMEPFETGSHIDIPAHSAPLGLAFAPASWPEKYRDDLFVAYHGSWNRSTPTGYKIVRFKLDKNGYYDGTDSTHSTITQGGEQGRTTDSPQVEDFITGWLSGSSDGALGRPVDILIKNDVMYISDDKAGVIYALKPHT